MALLRINWFNENRGSIVLFSKGVLITGGAGFIGTHVARRLVSLGVPVRILDSFSEQVHSERALPKDLSNCVELYSGDINDRSLMFRALEGMGAVLHLAAETGTGQSMYEIERYFRVNVQGTALLLDILQNDQGGKNVTALVVASSRAVYGEGAYRCTEHGVVFPEQRGRTQMGLGLFEPQCPLCEAALLLQGTQESAPFRPMSVYGLTKQVQEQAVLLYGKTRGINAFGLRYQNVYGPGQSLKNPYTGILAVFSNLARQNQAIDIYEDGLESRDFVYIDDVVEATVRSLNFKGSFVGALNVGSGQATSVMTVAEEVKLFFQSDSRIAVTGAFRMGDIRHNLADTSALKKVLDFVPSVGFKEGLNNFLTWASSQPAEDKSAYVRSVNELSAKGLMGSSAASNSA